MVKKHDIKTIEKRDDFEDFDDMVQAHRSVFKSLIDQDEKYKLAEAVEINNAFGKQVNIMKLKLETFKVLKEIPTRGELFLPEKKK